MAPRWVAPIAVCMINWVHDYSLEHMLMDSGSTLVGPLSVTLPLATAAVTSCAGAFWKMERGLTVRRAADWRALCGCAALLGAGSVLSMRSLNFVSFPVRLVGKSCKPAATALVASLAARSGMDVHHRNWPRAVAVGVGGALYLGYVSWADEHAQQSASSGVVLLALSVGCEAIAVVIEEALLAHRRACPVDLAVRINRWKLPLLLILACWGGAPAMMMLGTRLVALCFILSVLGACGQLCIFTTVQLYGGEFASSLGVFRKAGTLWLSSRNFGHSVSTVQFCGLAIMALGMVLPRRLGPRRVSVESYRRLAPQPIPV